MSASRVTYADKNEGLPVTDERRKFFDVNANELKTVINNHADLIDTLVQKFRGNHDPSSGEFPSSGGNLSNGRPAFGDHWQTTADGTLAGRFIPRGTWLYARQDEPTDDWDTATGWKDN